jgi:hypothetical protein
VNRSGVLSEISHCVTGGGLRAVCALCTLFVLHCTNRPDLMIVGAFVVLGNPSPVVRTQACQTRQTRIFGPFLESSFLRIQSNRCGTIFIHFPKKVRAVCCARTPLELVGAIGKISMLQPKIPLCPGLCLERFGFDCGLLGGSLWGMVKLGLLGIPGRNVARGAHSRQALPLSFHGGSTRLAWLPLAGGTALVCCSEIWISCGGKRRTVLVCCFETWTSQNQLLSEDVWIAFLADFISLHRPHPWVKESSIHLALCAISLEGLKNMQLPDACAPLGE